MPHIHLIAPTVTPFNLESAVEHLRDYGVEFSSSHLTMGPASVESEFDELFAGPDTVIKAMEAEASGADAVIVLCMGDPGVKQAREAVSIPVLGPGETAMHYAAMLGHKFTIMPTLPRRRSTYEHHARLYGVESRLASVRPVGVSVLEIETNETVRDTLIGNAVKAVEEDGADVLILGCVGFRDIDTIVADALKKRGHDVPVIDALPLTIMTAATLVWTGLSHSKNAFPFPPPKEFKGYPLPE
jgi:allantoin racemase